MTANPEVFNKGQLNAPGPSAGPFIVSTVDRGGAANHVDPQPEMVGPQTAAGLHHLPGTRRLRPASRRCRTTRSTPPAWARSTTWPPRQRTRASSIRSAPAAPGPTSRSMAHPGSILADQTLRLAIAKGIDRQAIVNVIQHGLVDHPVPLNNHIYVDGQAGYQDNSAASRYNPDAGRAGLGCAGLEASTDRFRENDGKPAGDSRCALRRARPPDRPGRPEQPGADRRQAGSRRQTRATVSSANT